MISCYLQSLFYHSTETVVPVCGNGVVEEGEQCDCGTKCHLDNCCYGNKDGPVLACLLKEKAVCR